MKTLIKKGQYLENVVFKGKNVIIQKIETELRSKRCIVIGNGHSLSVDEDDKITLHDPGMSKFAVSMKHTVYAFYFTFESDGLLESSKELAEFVNKISYYYEEVILIGHSKCGVCVQNAKQYINRKNTIVTISAPFDGTFIADKKACESKLKNLLFIKIYNKIFSNHNVDKDIMPNSEFIQNMNRQCIDFNITSSINKVGDCKNIKDLILFIFDKMMKVNGDGIVSLDSQMKCFANIDVNISCSHASSLQKGLEVVRSFILS